MSLVLSAKQKNAVDDFQFQRGSGLGKFQRGSVGGAISPFIAKSTNGGQIDPFVGNGMRKRINPMVGRGRGMGGGRVRFRPSKFGARGGIINLRHLFHGLRRGVQSAFEASRPILKKAILSAGQQSLQSLKEGQNPKEAVKSGARAGLKTAKRGNIKRKAIEGALTGFTGLPEQREDPEGVSELFGSGIRGRNIARRKIPARKVRNIVDGL